MAAAGRQVLRLITWNVAGLRGLLRRAPDALSELLVQERPDICCLQETRLQDKDVAAVAAHPALQGYHATWSCSTERPGHAGVLTLSRQAPRQVHRGFFDGAFAAAGRAITSVHPTFFLVNVYVPNSGDGLKNLQPRLQGWDPALAAHLTALRRRGPVVLTGDLNVAPAPLDVYDPHRLRRSAGFTLEEREHFAKLLLGQNFVDAFRQLHPQMRAYSFFSWRGGMRHTQRGWRLDHMLLSDDLLPRLQTCTILQDVPGSDHLPVRLTLRAPAP